MSLVRRLADMCSSALDWLDALIEEALDDLFR